MLAPIRVAEHVMEIAQERHIVRQLDVLLAPFVRDVILHVIHYAERDVQVHQWLRLLDARDVILLVKQFAQQHVKTIANTLAPRTLVHQNAPQRAPVVLLQHHRTYMLVVLLVTHHVQDALLYVQ